MEPLLPRRRRKWPIRIGILIALVAISIFLFVKFAASIWLNGQRQQLEMALSQATGYTTRINGTITATLLPTPGFSLGGITMERDGHRILAANSFEVNFDLPSLFDHKLVPHQVEISKLWLELSADRDGVPVAGIKTSDSNATLGGVPFGLKVQVPDRVEIRDSTVVVQSVDNKELDYIKGLNLAITPARHRIALLKYLEPGTTTPWQLRLYANFEQARFNRLDLGQTNLSALFGAEEGSAILESSQLLDGAANGKLTWEKNESGPLYHVALKLDGIDAARSVQMFRPDSFVHGNMSLGLDLTTSGTSPEQLLANSSGTLQMDGNDLDLTTTNIDELVTRIISSQKYNLVDAAAYFFIGPFAVSATKGLDLAGIARELAKPGNTPNKIRRIHTEWHIKNGIASANDVALQTPRYLLALKGRINLVKNTFESVEIGVINHQGCAIATQKIYGPISSPSMEKTNVLLSLTRPMLDALTKSAKDLMDRNCDKPFYQGELVKTGAPPAESQSPATETSPPGTPATETSKPTG